MRAFAFIIALQLALLPGLLAVGEVSTTPAPTPAPGLVVVYEVDCAITAYSTTDCPSHDLLVTRAVSTGSSSTEWPASYIAVAVLLFLLVTVIMGLVIAVYVRQQPGYSQVEPDDYSQPPPYNYAEACKGRKTIGVDLVRVCVPDA